MADRIAFTRVAANIVLGNQDIRIAGLTQTPIACVIIASNTLADNTPVGEEVISFGCGTSSTARWVCGFLSRDNVATTSTRRDFQTDQIISIRLVAGGTIDGEADLVGFLTDVGSGAGVRINWTDAPSAAFLLTVILICADNALAGTYATQAAAGLTTTVTPGFQSDLIIGASTTDPANTLNTGPSQGTIGFCDGSLNQWAWYFVSSTAVLPSSLGARLASARLAGRPNAAGTENYGSEITSITATQFVATQRIATGGGDDIGFLAVDFAGSCSVDLLDIPTVLGVQTIADPGFSPQFAFYLATNSEAVDTAYTDNRASSFSLCAFDTSGGMSNAWFDEDNISPSNAGSLSDDVAVRLLDDDGTSLAVGTSQAFTATGWTIDWTTVPATAKKCIVFSVEQVAGVGGASVVSDGSRFLGNRVLEGFVV